MNTANAADADLFDAERLICRLEEAGAALLAIDEVMTLWADDPSLRDPLGLLNEALQILDGPSIFPQKA